MIIIFANFNPFIEIAIYIYKKKKFGGGQMYSFEVVNNSPLYYIHKELLDLSKCLSKWIKMDK